MLTRSARPDFDAANPAFNYAAIRRNRDIYDGLARPGVVKRYLVRSEMERDESYAERVRRASYINLAAPVADLFASAVTASVNRWSLSLIPRFAPMLTDCDSHGSGPDAFFRRVCGQASAIGAHFVLADMPVAAEPAASRKDAESLGLVPYFVSIPAENVRAWDFGPDGKLEYAVIHGTRHESAGPFTPFSEVRTREVWTRTEWRRYESRGGKEFIPAGQGAHPCGEVPLVPFLFEEVTPMTGLSVFDAVAANIIQLFNCWSEYDKSLAYSSTPMMLFRGIDPAAVQKLIQASDTAIASEKADMDAKYVETSGVSFTAKRAQIEDAVRYVTNVSLRRTRPDSAASVSADSKREDNRELVALMKEFAAAMAESEKKCWRYAAKWLGLNSPEAARPDIRYEVRYDTDEVGEGSIQTLIDLVTNGIFNAEFISPLIYRSHFIQSRLTNAEREHGWEKTV